MRPRRLPRFSLAFLTLMSCDWLPRFKSLIETYTRCRRGHRPLMVVLIRGWVSAIRPRRARLAGKNLSYLSRASDIILILLLRRKKLAECAGHFGYIQLELPVFHAGYFRHTLGVLQCICKRCSRILLSYDDRLSFLKKAKAPNLDALARGAMFKRVAELCKRASTCPYCGYSNGKTWCL